MIPKRWREQRRERALVLRGQGWTQCQITQALGMLQAAISRWLVRARGSERWGRPSKLATEYLRLVPDLLSHGAEV